MSIYIIAKIQDLNYNQGGGPLGETLPVFLAWILNIDRCFLNSTDIQQKHIE